MLKFQWKDETHGKCVYEDVSWNVIYFFAKQILKSLLFQ